MKMKETSNRCICVFLSLRTCTWQKVNILLFQKFKNYKYLKFNKNQSYQSKVIQTKFDITYYGFFLCLNKRKIICFQFFCFLFLFQLQPASSSVKLLSRKASFRCQRKLWRERKFSRILKCRRKLIYATFTFTLTFTLKLKFVLHLDLDLHSHLHLHLN